jgi:hypothetical protein
MQVRIGRMRANDKLALHLEINGATCNRTRPVMAETTTRNASDARLCKSCFNPNRIKAAQLKAQSGSFNVKADTILCWAVDMTRTPAEKARIAELVADYRAAHAEPVEVVKPRSLADLRNAYAHTHKQPVKRPAYVNIAA